MPFVMYTGLQQLAIWNKACPEWNSANLNLMHLRSAVTDDISGLMALETSPIARPFVGQWSKERHLATIGSEDAKYFIRESEEGAMQAYVILRGFSEDCRAIELKRIVVAVPERGLGRQVLTEVVRMAFEEINAHRLFLDVFEDNVRARHLYESLGFTYEGILREAAQRDGKWFNLHLMSMLETEYRALSRVRKASAAQANGLPGC